MSKRGLKSCIMFRANTKEAGDLALRVLRELPGGEGTVGVSFKYDLQTGLRVAHDATQNPSAFAPPPPPSSPTVDEQLATVASLTAAAVPPSPPGSPPHMRLAGDLTLDELPSGQRASHDRLVSHGLNVLSEMRINLRTHDNSCDVIWRTCEPFHLPFRRLWDVVDEGLRTALAVQASQTPLSMLRRVFANVVDTMDRILGPMLTRKKCFDVAHTQDSVLKAKLAHDAIRARKHHIVLAQWLAMSVLLGEPPPAASSVSTQADAAPRVLTMDRSTQVAVLTMDRSTQVALPADGQVVEVIGGNRPEVIGSVGTVVHMPSRHWHRAVPSGGVAVQFHNHRGGFQPEIWGLAFSEYGDLRIVTPHRERERHCLLLCGSCSGGCGACSGGS